MEYGNTFRERSLQDRRSGADRRIDSAVTECCDHFGIGLSEKTLDAIRKDEKRKNDRRQGERRAIWT
jgi:hypothetical protein